MLDFLVFVTYIMDIKDVTFSEAKIEATIRCEKVAYTKYSKIEGMSDICSEVWKNSFPDAYIYE